MTIRVMPSECLSRSYLLAVCIEPARHRTVTNKAFGGRRRWASIYPFEKRNHRVELRQEQPYKGVMVLKPLV